MANKILRKLKRFSPFYRLHETIQKLNYEVQTMRDAMETFESDIEDFVTSDNVRHEIERLEEIIEDKADYPDFKHLEESFQGISERFDDVEEATSQLTAKYIESIEKDELLHKTVQALIDVLKDAR